MRVALGSSRRGCASRPGCSQGKSSVPVSRQPMPRMWLSPSPPTLSQTPLRTVVCFLNGFEGLQDFRQLEVGAGLGRPEVLRHDAVGAEDHHEALLGARLVGEREARQVGHEGERGGADAHLGQEAAAGRRELGHGWPWGRGPVGRESARAVPAFRRGRGVDGDARRQVSDIVAEFRELVPQLRLAVRPVGPHRLLHQVVEQLLGRTSLAPRGSSARYFASSTPPVKLADLAGLRQVAALRVHRLAAVLGAVAARWRRSSRARSRGG